MENDKSMSCGHETAPSEACPDRGHANGNGKAGRPKPPPPPELAGVVFEPTPPEMAEDIRRSFDEDAFFAEMEEVLKTGGADIDALIARIERKVHGGN